MSDWAAREREIRNRLATDKAVGVPAWEWEDIGAALDQIALQRSEIERLRAENETLRTCNQLTREESSHWANAFGEAARKALGMSAPPTATDDGDSIAAFNAQHGRRSADFLARLVADAKLAGQIEALEWVTERLKTQLHGDTEFGLGMQEAARWAIEKCAFRLEWLRAQAAGREVKA